MVASPMALAASSCHRSLSFSHTAVGLSEGSTDSIRYTHNWCSGDPAFTDWVMDISDTTAVTIAVKEGDTKGGTHITIGSIGIEALADDDFDDESVTVTFYETSADYAASVLGRTVASKSFTVDVRDPRDTDGDTPS